MTGVNLLPDDYIARAAQKRANRLCLALFALVMLGVVVAGVASERAYRNTLGVAQRVDESYTQAVKLVQQMQELEATRAKMVAKASSTARLLEPVPRSYLLATIANALPEGASLSKFELKSQRGAGTVTISRGGKTQFDSALASRQGSGEPPPLVVSMTLTGLAGTDVDVARFITAMARCPLMQSVDLVYSQEKLIEQTTVREFQVTLALKPEAEVRKDQPSAGETPAIRTGETPVIRAGETPANRSTGILPVSPTAVSAVAGAGETPVIPQIAHGGQP